MSYISSRVWGRGKPTLAETNIAPENSPFHEESSLSNHQFSAAMLVLGRVKLASHREEGQFFIALCLLRVSVTLRVP